MADINVKRETATPVQEGYTVVELVFWVVGILMIPLVPILMIMFLTPHRGM